MNRPGEFTRSIQEFALARQQNLCASCGTPIFSLGDAGRAQHKLAKVPALIMSNM